MDTDDAPQNEEYESDEHGFALRRWVWSRCRGLGGRDGRMVGHVDVDDGSEVRVPDRPSSSLLVEWLASIRKFTSRRRDALYTCLYTHRPGRGLPGRSGQARSPGRTPNRLIQAITWGRESLREMDDAGDFIHLHASGREKPGQIPEVDAGEDVPHLVALDGSQSGSAEEAGELGAAWAVWVAREVGARQMREERACFLRGGGGPRASFRMLEPGEGEGGPGTARELWVAGEVARRFPRPPDQSAVFAEALLAGVTPRQDTSLDGAALRAGVELLSGGEGAPDRRAAG